MQIIPTIFEKEFLEAERRIKLVKDLTTWMQIDVIDGKFLSGKTFELELLTRVEGIEKNLLDIHLMVENPIKWINKCLFTQASRIIGSVEAIDDRDEFVKMAKDTGMEVGLGFDIDTEIDEKIPKETDVILLMARKAGFGNYKFDERVYKRIERLVKIKKDMDLDFLIGVDGGIKPSVVDELRKAKVDIIYCGKYFMEIVNAIN
mgnify:CR=1 FL=1